MNLRDHHRKLTYGGWAIGVSAMLAGVIPGAAIGLLMIALGQYYALSNITGRRLSHLWRKPNAAPRPSPARQRTR